MSSFLPANSYGLYLPLDFEIPDADSEFKEAVAQRERLTSSTVNIKENAQYELSELQSCQQWFSIQTGSNPRQTRYGFRKVIDFGAITSPGLKSVAHGLAGITNTWIFTDIKAVARNPTSSLWIPIPWYDGTNNIMIYVDAVNVNIQTNTAAFAGYTQCYVVLEYLKG
jgi:hypothetical protein